MLNTLGFLAKNELVSLKRMKTPSQLVYWPEAFYSHVVTVYESQNNEGFSSFRIRIWSSLTPRFKKLLYLTYFSVFLIPALAAILTLMLPFKNEFFSQPGNVAVITGFLYFPLSVIIVAILHEKIVTKMILKQMRSSPKWEGVFLVQPDTSGSTTGTYASEPKQTFEVLNLWVLVAPLHHIKTSYLSSNEPFELIRPSDRFDIDLKIRQAHPDNFAIPVISTPSYHLYPLIPVDVFGLSEKNLPPDPAEQQWVRRILIELYHTILQDFPQLSQGQEEYFLTNEGFVYSPKLLF